VELRRCPHIVWHWQDDCLLMHNYALDRTAVSSPLVVNVLEQFHSWRLLECFLRTHPPEVRPSLMELVDALVSDRWLWQRHQPLLPGESAMEEWDGWNPAAGFFHAATRNPRIVGLEELLPRLAEKAATAPMPASTKTYPEAGSVSLPVNPGHEVFPTVLRERRTWRRFGDAAVDLTALATLLHLSAGVQAWGEAEGEGTVAFKTSPSGGARHPIELYLAVRNVRGLEPGLYHFDAGGHRLERLAPDVAEFTVYLPDQAWYRSASALVFFTGVFERTRWRYPGPRAYRAVLLEAGHVCQTFCLTATWLGLAPFCSMALADAAIETALGLDGTSEAVLYAAGVGTRPELAEGELPGSLEP
jgi:SagB-type dehydrogenase family enzyme